MAFRRGIAKISFMALNAQDLAGDAAHKLEAIRREIKISQADLSRAVGLSPTGLNYYFPGPEKRYRGRFLPMDKPWSHTLRSVLIAKGAPPSIVALLFESQQEGFHSLEERIDGLERQLAQVIEILQGQGFPPH